MPHHRRHMGRQWSGYNAEHWAYWRQRYHLYRRSFGPLRRRMFLWFGLTILLTGVAVIASVAMISRPGSAWERGETERLRQFASGRFAVVWDRPEALGE